MKFVQLIEFTTSRYDDVNAVMDEWMAATGGRRTPTREVTGRDRDRANVYVQIVEFPSYEAAMRNNDLPETADFAAQIQALCGAMAFRNLDVVREESL